MSGRRRAELLKAARATTAKIPRIRTLEEQIIFCELSGRHIKASLLRSTVQAIKIATEADAAQGNKS